MGGTKTRLIPGLTIKFVGRNNRFIQTGIRRRKLFSVAKGDGKGSHAKFRLLGHSSRRNPPLRIMIMTTNRTEAVLLCIAGGQYYYFGSFVGRNAVQTATKYPRAYEIFSSHPVRSFTRFVSIGRLHLVLHCGRVLFRKKENWSKV